MTFHIGSRIASYVVGLAALVSIAGCSFDDSKYNPFPAPRLEQSASGVDSGATVNQEQSYHLHLHFYDTRQSGSANSSSDNGTNGTKDSQNSGRQTLAGDGNGTIDEKVRGQDGPSSGSQQSEKSSRDYNGSFGSVTHTSYEALKKEMDGGTTTTYHHDCNGNEYSQKTLAEPVDKHSQPTLQRENTGKTNDYDNKTTYECDCK